MEDKKRIISLGNGCDSKIFFNELKMDIPGPLDSVWLERGPILMKYVFNGDFFKAIENRDIFPFQPQIKEEDVTVVNGFCNNFPTVRVNGEEFRYPHISYYSFMRHIDERVENLKKAFEDPNTVYSISNGLLSKFTPESYCKDILSWAPFLKGNLIVVCEGLRPWENEWAKLGVPSIELKDNPWIYQKFDERRFYFYAAYTSFSKKYPELASRLIEPTI